MHAMYRVGVGGRERARRKEGQREVNFKELAHDCGDVGVQPAGRPASGDLGTSGSCSSSPEAVGRIPSPSGDICVFLFRPSTA